MTTIDTGSSLEQGAFRSLFFYSFLGFGATMSNLNKGRVSVNRLDDLTKLKIHGMFDRVKAANPDVKLGKYTVQEYAKMASDEFGVKVTYSNIEGMLEKLQIVSGKEGNEPKLANSSMGAARGIALYYQRTTAALKEISTELASVKATLQAVTEENQKLRAALEAKAQASAEHTQSMFPPGFTPQHFQEMIDATNQLNLLRLSLQNNFTTINSKLGIKGGSALLSPEGVKILDNYATTCKKLYEAAMLKPLRADA